MLAFVGLEAYTTNTRRKWPKPSASSTVYRPSVRRNPLRAKSLSGPSPACRQPAMSVLRSCAKCGAANRVPARHLADTGRCGSCKQPLPPQDSPIDADAATLDEIVRGARVPILVDFWASWCGPCRMAAPEVKAVAREMTGKAIVLKVDTEAHPELAARFKVQGIPNFVVLRKGKVVQQRAGVAPRSEMRRWLQEEGASAAGGTATPQI